MKRKNGLLKRICHYEILKNNTKTHVLITENYMKLEYGLDGRNYEVISD